MKHTFIFLSVLIFPHLMPLQAAESDICWVLQYDGKSLPAAPWVAIGKPNAKLAEGVLHLSDTSKDDLGAFEAEWNGDLDGKEIVVEARIKLLSMVGHRDSPTATWPQRDGAPICIQVSDGKHEEA